MLGAAEVNLLHEHLQVGVGLRIDRRARRRTVVDHVRVDQRRLRKALEKETATSQPGAVLHDGGGPRGHLDLRPHAAAVVPGGVVRDRRVPKDICRAAVRGDAAAIVLCDVVRDDRDAQVGRARRVDGAARLGPVVLEVCTLEEPRVARARLHPARLQPRARRGEDRAAVGVGRVVREARVAARYQVRRVVEEGGAAAGRSVGGDDAAEEGDIALAIEEERAAVARGAAGAAG
mmetsp:Transcript_55077/g.163918  ORF Transcript_55077/g.163918 Transcript_55077/m.163918 type:complete len:233 (+) Transcript_55077:6525-7223(+)